MRREEKEQNGLSTPSKPAFLALLSAVLNSSRTVRGSSMAVG